MLRASRGILSFHSQRGLRRFSSSFRRTRALRGRIGEILLGLHGEPNARDLIMQEGMR